MSFLKEFYEVHIVYKLIFLLVFVLPAIFGSYSIYTGVGEIFLAKKSKNWPSVYGEIVMSLHTTNDATGGTGSGNPRGASSMTLEYRYEIDGKAFTGDRVMFGYINNFFTSDSYRRSKVYPRSKNVTVYYNPQNPKQCVLEPGIHVPYSWNKVMIGLIVMIPVYVLVYNLFANKEEEREDDNKETVYE